MPEVLHIVTSLCGGGARHIHTLIQGLAGQSGTCALLAPDDEPALSAQFRSSGILWRALPPENSNPLKIVSAIRRAIHDFQPAIVHLHGHRAGLFGRLAVASISNQRPAVVTTFHGYHPPFYRYPWSRLAGNSIERMLAPLSDAFIAVSPSTAEFAAQALCMEPDDIDIIPNGIPLQGPPMELERKTARQELLSLFSQSPLDHPPVLIGCIARLHRQKGVDLLLEAWRIFAQRSPLIQNRRGHFHLLIAGDGPERKYYRLFCQEYGLESNVHFLGAIPSSRGFLSGVDLFVLPSRWEGLPLTVLEAWDAGTPVLATKVPGNCGLIRHDIDGFLVEPLAEQLARALALLSGDSKRRARFITQAGIKIKNYSAEKMAESVQAVYRRIVNEQAGCITPVSECLAD